MKRRSPSPAAAAKGAAGERAFATWLDGSVLPHIYIEQSPLTVPAPLRGKMKRPDYLVGIPGVGVVAFDVKAISIYGGELLFAADEVHRLRNFARLFHLTVYFACLGDASPAGYWVRLDDLEDLRPVRRRYGMAYAFPVEQALAVSIEEPFYQAFVRAVAL